MCPGPPPPQLWAAAELRGRKSDSHNGARPWETLQVLYTLTRTAGLGTGAGAGEGGEQRGASSVGDSPDSTVRPFLQGWGLEVGREGVEWGPVCGKLSRFCTLTRTAGLERGWELGREGTDSRRKGRKGWVGPLTLPAGPGWGKGREVGKGGGGDRAGGWGAWGRGGGGELGREGGGPGREG